MKITVIPNVIGPVTKGLVQGQEDLEIRGRVDADHSFIKIGHKTEESPGDLRRLAVTQTPMRNHRLILVGKTFKRI